jgi:U3 small nucleolar RNA-associated protein 10
MVSSLVAQLAQNASLNSNRLLQKRKNRESYLFTGREADEHDLDTIHALGVNGLIQLSSLNQSIRVYEEVLFSHSVKGVDRTLLSVDADAELNKNISGLLKLLGPYLMEPPTGKVIEWLVKRFR